MVKIDHPGVIELVKNSVKQYTTKEIIEMIHRQWGLVYYKHDIENLKNKYGIKTGELRGTFKKGQIPINKGKKQIEYMTPEAIERTKNTRFKKGEFSPNRKPLGSERVMDGYTYVKIQDFHGMKNWYQKHYLIWEKAHGPILKGYKLIFLDGDRTNIVLENLALVGSDELLAINQLDLISSDPNITKVAISVGKLVAKTNQVIKKKKEL